MANQTFVLGVPSIVHATQVIWRVNLPVEADLLDTSENLHLTELGATQSGAIWVYLFKDGDIANSELSGDFANAIEQASVFGLLARSGDDESFVFRGPNASGNVLTDPTEPYTWIPPTAEAGGALVSWVNERTSDSYSLTIRDQASDIYVGNTRVVDVRLGTTVVSRVYLGSDIVFVDGT